MSNRRLMDRMATPELMDIGLRVARMEKSHAEARELLEIALRDEIDSETARRKTATILAGSWLKPAREATLVVDWAREHAAGDLRVWHLGVLLSGYRFFGDVCARVGRRLGMGEVVDSRDLRAALKSEWGDREVVDVATRGAVRTLRAFGVLASRGDRHESEQGSRLEVDDSTYPWLVHSLLVSRGISEIDMRSIPGAPELFPYDLPTRMGNGYPYLERFTEGSGRTVVQCQVPRVSPRGPAARQLTLDVEAIEQ